MPVTSKHLPGRVGAENLVRGVDLRLSPRAVEARDHRQHDVQTPLPDLLPAPRLARTAGPSAGTQERRDPRLAPRGRGLAPTSQPTTLLLARPGRPRGVDPPPTKAASAPSIRDAGDIAALASGPDQTPLDVPAPPARSALDGARTASPDPAAGSGEPDVGVPAHARRTCPASTKPRAEHGVAAPQPMRYRPGTAPRQP